MDFSGPEQVAKLEREFDQNLKANKIGTAYVRISQLSFPNPLRRIDRKIVDKLKRDFGKEGCLVHQQGCSIPAVLNEDEFRIGLEKLGVSSKTFKANSLNSPPRFELSINAKLSCLHGQHRVHAAAEYLPPEDRWWMVDLYREGIDAVTAQRLREGHSYSTNYTTGEIYRQIRRCQSEKDKVTEDRWRGRLSALTEKYLKKLLKRDLLVIGLDSILPFRGLWKHFQLGSMDIFLSIRCDEEIANYIHFIGEIWSQILGDPNLVQLLDEATVEALHLRAPVISKQDAEYIEKGMRSGHLFPEIKDSTIRNAIRRRLLKIEERIPSLFSLFKDLRYLEPSAKAMRALLPKSAKEGSLRQNFRFRSSFPGNTTRLLELQDSESSYTSVSGSPEYLFDQAYRQTFLGAIRYFTSPSTVTTKKDMNPINQTAIASKRLLGFKLVELALRSGFSVPNISDVLSKDPEARFLEDILHSLPRELYKFDLETPQPLLESFKNYLHTSTVKCDSRVLPSITTATAGEPISQRCGRSCSLFDDDDDRLHMFLPKLHATFAEMRRDGNEVSSFYVKRSIYLAFFGNITAANSANRNSERNTTKPQFTNLDGNAPFNSELGLEPSQNAQIVQNQARLPEQNQSSFLAPQGVTFHLNSFVPQTTVRDVEFVSEDGATLYRVPFEKEVINNKARELGLSGQTLKSVHGDGIYWSDCYDRLLEIGSTKVWLDSRKRRRRSQDNGQIEATANRPLIRTRQRLRPPATLPDPTQLNNIFNSQAHPHAMEIEEQL